MKQQSDLESRGAMEAWLEHRVSYGETDTMGVLYYAEYLHIFERGRNSFIRAFGLSYREVEERGLYLPVREAGCRYRSPARYDDLIRLRSILAVWGRASLTFRYELWDEDRARLLAEGFTQHACVNAKGRPVPVPDWFRSRF
ncbi:acyl-CoA thioesterase [Desulfovibrio sp. OttesenSCG-928-G11]|nr:acyl-CoA thioesterase [Desulfovibrio sp. OttesenSCG-928-G11]